MLKDFLLINIQGYRWDALEPNVMTTFWVMSLILKYLKHNITVK